MLTVCCCFDSQQSQLSLSLSVSPPLVLSSQQSLALCISGLQAHYAISIAEYCIRFRF